MYQQITSTNKITLKIYIINYCDFIKSKQRKMINSQHCINLNQINKQQQIQQACTTIVFIRIHMNIYKDLKLF